MNYKEKLHKLEIFIEDMTEQYLEKENNETDVLIKEYLRGKRIAYEEILYRIDGEL